MSRLAILLRRIEEAILASGILLIAAVTIANAFSRAALNASLASSEEISRFSIVFVTFFGLSYAAGLGRHIRMSAIYDQLPLRARKALLIVISAATSALLLTMAWHALGYVLAVRASGTVSPVLRAPLYVVYAAAPLGFLLAGAQYALAAVRNCLDDGLYLSWDTADEYEELPHA